MFPSTSGVVIYGGTFINKNCTSKGMDILKEWVVTGAFHTSDELYDAPKCHPHTRVAVLEDIMEWVSESESARDTFMLWLFGPAGAGKSAIAKRIAEISAEKGLLIADFFFSRTSPTRGTKGRLIATLAYQLALSIPSTRSYIEDAIERDPVISNKNILIQINALLIKPFLSISSAQIVPSQKLIIIDGLDECDDSKFQVAIFEAISCSFLQHNLPIKFLLVSRPEPDIDTAFNCNEPLRSIHRRLALDDTYRPYDDIRLFFSDKFEHIKRTHRLRSNIPTSWPTQETLETLVAKSSGQFIYASTVVRFVESSNHRPTKRLNIILGVSPPGPLKPFAELDALYDHILSSVDDIQITLRVLSLYVMTPLLFESIFRYSYMSPELFLSLEPGDVQFALMNLSSILTYDAPSGTFKVLHASLVDFLSDRHRSATFYIDTARTCTDFVSRTLQYVKVPHGIRAGDINLFYEVIGLSPWILKGHLRSDILEFDLEAFINASIKWMYSGQPILLLADCDNTIIVVFSTWKQLLSDAGLEDLDKTEALDRLNKYFESRLRVYQSDWRLRLLLTLVVTNVWYDESPGVPQCRCLDILLEMNDHALHLIDQHALDLRHGCLIQRPKLNGMLTSDLDGDAYASAALHCMRFLSNPPRYCEKNEYPGVDLISIEWRVTCGLALLQLCKLLQQANASPELVQFISDHDVHPAVQNAFLDDHYNPSIWEVNIHIFAFLSRSSVCPNWRIVSAIQRSLKLHKERSTYYQICADPSDWFTDEDTVNARIDAWLNPQRPRLDNCCRSLHFEFH